MYSIKKMDIHFEITSVINLLVFLNIFMWLLDDNKCNLNV